MTQAEHWNKSYEHPIPATPDKIWQAFIDTSSWKHWNPGVKSIALEGAFQAGTWFSMALPDGEMIRSRLIDVAAKQHFTDETLIGETRVRVEHRIEASGPGQCQLIYAIRTQGPDAQALGEGISADFPDVMAGLAHYLAEQKA